MTTDPATAPTAASYVIDSAGNYYRVGGGGGGEASGPAGGDLSGYYPDPAIAPGAIVNSHVNAAAAIAQSKIQNLTGDLAARPPLTFAAAAPTTPNAGNWWLDITTGVLSEAVDSGFTLWGGVVPTGYSTSSEPTYLTLGTKFSSSVAGTVTGISVLNPGNGALTVGLYLKDSPFTLLASQAYGTATRPAGWNTFPITPVSISAGTGYIAVFFYPPTTVYSYTWYYFTSAHVNGPLTAPVDSAESTRNGVLQTASSLTYPDQDNGKGTSYWVEPVFSPTVPLWVPRADLALNSELATLYQERDEKGIADGYAELTEFATVPWVQLPVTFSPSVPTGGAEGYWWLNWTTQELSEKTGGSSTSSIWYPTTPTETVTHGSDGVAITLGTRFTVSDNGTIGGIAVYQPPSGSGSALTAVLYEFGNPAPLSEQAYGEATRPSTWVVFDIPPVEVTAGHTYIACYAVTSSGDFSVTGSVFVGGPIVSGDLTATNGHYAYGGVVYPDNANNSSYWADPVFTGAAAWTVRADLATKQYVDNKPSTPPFLLMGA